MAPVSLEGKRMVASVRGLVVFSEQVEMDFQDKYIKFKITTTGEGCSAKRNIETGGE